MKKVFHFIGLVFLLFLSEFFESCASFSAFACRHEISEVSIEQSGKYSREYSGLCKTSGDHSLFFTFRNFSEKTVTGFSVCYKLFLQESGQEPFAEDENYFECNASSCAVFHSYIPQGSSESFAINLDSCLYEETEQFMQVDFIYVSEIQYDDGSVWKDIYGAFGF